MLRHLLNSSDLSKPELSHLLSVANDIASSPTSFQEVGKGKILATLFFEPSTRTRLSFESAMLRLGGSVLGFSDAASTSSSKGETPEDTARIVSCYADIIAVRHPLPKTPHHMSEVATVPVINAGDGSNQHPTQTLTDLCTILQKFGRLDHLCIGFCGDLKYGRTVHSLITQLSRYPNNHFYCIAPDELQIPQEYLDHLEQAECSYTITDQLDPTLEKIDVLYMTRIQKERFEDLSQYYRLKGVYVLDGEKMKQAKQDMIVLHPLPRVDEIAKEVDDDERAWYFKQAQMGVYVRMALIIFLLDLKNHKGESFYDHSIS